MLQNFFSASFSPLSTYIQMILTEVKPKDIITSKVFLKMATEVKVIKVLMKSSNKLKRSSLASLSSLVESLRITLGQVLT